MGPQGRSRRQRWRVVWRGLFACQHPKLTKPNFRKLESASFVPFRKPPATLAFSTPLVSGGRVIWAASGLSTLARCEDEHRAILPHRRRACRICAPRRLSRQIGAELRRMAGKCSPRLQGRPNRRANAPQFRRIVAAPLEFGLGLTRAVAARQPSAGRAGADGSVTGTGQQADQGLNPAQRNRNARPAQGERLRGRPGADRAIDRRRNSARPRAELCLARPAR